MNALGAKILRAEIMGDEETANQLKARLESARKTKESVTADTSRQSDSQPGDKVRPNSSLVIVFAEIAKPHA